MADNQHAAHEADSEAKKWFVLAVVGTALYVGAVFTFVINGDLDDGKAPEAQTTQVEAEHGQPH